MRKRLFPILCLILTLGFASVSAAELVRAVRSKISAGDLASATALVEDYKKKTGVDPEYLDAVGWLARAAEMLNKLDVAAAHVAELRREIPQERPELLSPLGAAIEVEGKLLAVREGRGSAVRFLETEFAHATDLGLRTRIRKNINLLSLEGQPAPELNIANFVGSEPSRLAALKGKPVLLFLWAHWCGDCKAQAASLSRVLQKYRSRGLTIIAPTRFYGTAATEKPASPDEEKQHMQKVWSEFYGGLEGVSAPIDTETMVRYGVSATPTFVLIDRKGLVRFYSPTRLSEAELSRRIEAVLEEPL
ncbi:MAG: TlpA disulfide reductase family protein [Acidobacteriota bacterium]